MAKNLEYYRSLPYSLDVERFVEEEDGEVYYCASYEELPQVKGIHKDQLLAVKLAKELFDAYIEAKLGWGDDDIPEPRIARFRKRGGLFKFAADAGLPSGAADALVRQAPQPEKTQTSGAYTLATIG